MAAPLRGRTGNGLDLRDAGALALLVLVLTCAALLPLITWYAELDVAATILSVLHVVLCCLGAAAAVYGGLRPCLLVASVFPYCWLAIPAVYQISHTDAAWGDTGVTLNASATLSALAIIAVGQGALLVAYLLVPQRRGVRSPQRGLSATGRVRLVLMSGVLLVACLMLLPFVVSAAGGLGAFFTSREDLNESLASNGFEDTASPVGALVKIVPSALATVVVILSIHLFRSRKGPGDVGTRTAVLLGVIAVTLLSLFANPFASSRFLFLVSFGPLALVVLRPYRRPAAVAWLVGCVFAFLLAYPLADLFRRSDSAGASGAMLASKDFDGFQQAINTVTYVDVEGISWGSHLLSGLFFFIPRSAWPGKEFPASLSIAEERGYDFTNLSLPFPAEAYLNGGWVGLLVIMAGLGALFAVLDRAWRHGSHWALLTAFLAMAQVGLWRGPIGSQVPFFAFAAGLLVLALIISHQAGSAAGREEGATDSEQAPADQPARPGPWSA